MTNAPDAYPEITSLLVSKIMADNARRGAKPTAMGTRMRYSDAGRCLKQRAFKAYGYEPTNPMDPPGHWVTWLGEQVHKALQAVLVDTYGELVSIEHASQIDGLDCSGSSDATFFFPASKRVYELKTMGEYKFDSSVGVNRLARRSQEPKGPGASSKLQGALNALAQDADLLTIAHLSFSAFSKQLSEDIGVTDLDRFMAEWTYEREEWEPWALEETGRMAGLLVDIDNGYLPVPMAVNDDFSVSKLNPNIQNPKWNCVYCDYFDLCKTTPNTRVQIERKES